MHILRKTQNCKIKLTRGNSQWMEEERTCEDCTVPQAVVQDMASQGGAMQEPCGRQPCPQALLLPQHTVPSQGNSSFSAWDFCNCVHDGGDSRSMGDSGEWRDLLREAPPRACCPPGPCSFSPGLRPINLIPSSQNTAGQPEHPKISAPTESELADPGSLAAKEMS